MIDLAPLDTLFVIAALLPAIMLHELSHGLVASRMGDLTPKLSGRLTLNPARHVDPVGTVIVPALLLLPVLFGRSAPFAFGYAKPMPLDRSNLKNPDRQIIWISLAGPLTNLALAVVGALVLRFTAASPPSALFRFLDIWVFINVFVAVIHVFPIPPLDGSRVLAVFLPGRARQVFENLEPYGPLFILLILFLLPAPVLGLAGGAADGLRTLLVGA
ncbi:MAG TPA: site-2 protease family protein [Actinomycetota bacterium]|nr:site-2 protease family protein [Actinomycetota bacterium]